MFFSLNNNAPVVDFKQATIAGQAPDKGLYFPQKIPTFDEAFINNLKGYSNAEILYNVMKPYVGASMTDAELKLICEETVNFEIPLVKVTEDIYSLELFHGPTLAFKDVGARFMSRCLGHFVKNENEKVTVLVATSGDTGGAVANGFFEVDGVEVVVLYPSKKVSAVQEAQIATLGKNIKALEVNGTFDDCQQMVKEAFMDAELTSKLFLTSANSINVARWLPQQCYYLFAYKQWQHNEPPIVSVPSGNFGNICAGLLAHISGLPVKKFVAACNANNVVPEYFIKEAYAPKPAVATLSNAMDVGNPSNFVRILELFHHQFLPLKNAVSSYSISDTETIATIEEVYHQHQYLTDPHGAVAFNALQKELKDYPGAKGIFLETAHPVKFAEAIETTTGIKTAIPESIQAALKGQKQSFPLANNYAALKEYLLKA